MSAHTIEATSADDAAAVADQHGPVVDLLHVALEGQRPLAGGARFALRDVGQVELGRGPSLAARRDGSTLVVTLPDDRASSQHARLTRAGDGWQLADRGSRNGTYLGLERHEDGPLALDHPFSIGGTLFFLSRGSVREDDTTTLGATLAGREDGLASLVPEVAAGLARLAKIAASDLSVLLLGESGTGKEVLARATHALSRRAKGPFVAVNAGALTSTLLEAQLFGHIKGAFSGAIRDELGYFREASGGTLFLDEIGDLPEGSQAVLLRALETGEIVPVGATRPIKVDVRVIAATLRPVDSIREDLRMRLSGYRHRLVPLRERMPDLGILVAELLPRAAAARADRVRLSPEAVRAFGSHAWRMNMRELLQTLASAIVLAGDTGIVRLGDLPSGVAQPSSETAAATPAAAAPGPAPAAAATPAVPPRAAVPADERKRTLLLHLAAHRGNLSEVARQMNTTRVQVHRWIEKFAIDVEAYRGAPDDDRSES